MDDRHPRRFRGEVIMTQFITADSLKAQKTGPVLTEYAIGEQVKPFKIDRKDDGSLRQLLMEKPVGEFLGSSAMVEELAQIVTVQIQSGMDEHPLLYKPFYQTISDPNLPRLISSGFQMWADSVWLEHMEGQEVRFGTTRAEQGPTVPIITYTNGFEWDEDVEVYDEGWRVGLANKSIGDSYNALLNHLHLQPILSPDYTIATGFGNETAFTAAPSGNRIESIRLTLRQALADAALKVDSFGRKQPIRPTAVLTSLASAYEINDALALRTDTSAIGAGTNSNDLFLGRQSDTAGPNPSVNQLTSITAYDGDNMQMGNLRWDYAGPAADEAWLIMPKHNMFEYVKHDMRVDTERPSDLSRLVIAQMVARARRGLLAVPESSIWKVQLT